MNGSVGVRCPDAVNQAGARNELLDPLSETGPPAPRERYARREERDRGNGAVAAVHFYTANGNDSLEVLVATPLATCFCTTGCNSRQSWKIAEAKKSL